MIGVGFPKELIDYRGKEWVCFEDIDDCTTVLEFTMIISVRPQRGCSNELLRRL